MTSPVYDTEYVSFKEVKVPSKNAGERFFLKFYLHTAAGAYVLAATAEDQGDAHYCYKNSRGFNQYGILDSHSRKDVIMWLEKIIHESAAQFHKSVAGPERMLLKTAEHPDGVYFVAEDQKYSTFPDGRRCTEWYLTDNYGAAHRAVIGEENHARDGHYVYRSVEPFTSVMPLECKNKAGVYHWLEIWIVHEDGLSREKQRERQRRSRPKRRPVVLDVGSFGSSSRRYKKGIVSFRSQTRIKTPTVHPDILKAQDLTRVREKHVYDAVNFCFSKATEGDIESLQHWINILKELKSQWERGSIFSHTTQARRLPVNLALGLLQEASEDETVEVKDAGLVYLRRNFYGLCLEAFREIGTAFVSVELMQKTGIARVVASFRTYPTSDIAQYATHICARWSNEIEKHKHTMQSVDTLVDPMDVVAHLLFK